MRVTDIPIYFLCKIEMADKGQKVWEKSIATDAARLVIDSSLMHTDIKVFIPLIHFSSQYPDSY